MKFFFTSVVCLFLMLDCQAQLLINEVLYDPSNTALEGDANGDGTYDQIQDEFIEFVNLGPTALNISKYKIYDHVLATGVKTLRHTVANGIVIPSNGAFVVFGGGAAIGSFGGAIVSVDVGTQGLSLGNTGEAIVLEDSSGTRIDSIDTNALSDNPNESYTRSPDVTGIFLQHHLATAGVLFSPGNKVDGTPFAVTATLKEQKQAAFSVYPNPGAGVFTVSFNQPGITEIQVFNNTGRSVPAKLTADGKLDLSKEASGIYYLKATNGAALQTTRIQIIR